MTGWYGKVPGTGDFVARRLPAGFREAWDRWLQGAMEGSRQQLGGDWHEHYLSMPAWRFVASPGVLTAQGWAGVMLPSIDSVGRFFPLTVASPLPADGTEPCSTLLGAARWFDAIESAGLSALDSRTSLEQVDARISAQPFEASARPGAGPCAAWMPAGERPAAARTAWLAERSEIMERCLLLCEALPAAAQFCAMMDGRWAAHGCCRTASAEAAETRR